SRAAVLRQACGGSTCRACREATRVWSVRAYSPFQTIHTLERGQGSSFFMPELAERATLERHWLPFSGIVQWRRDVALARAPAIEMQHRRRSCALAQSALVRRLSLRRLSASRTSPRIFLNAFDSVQGSFRAKLTE